MRSVYVYLKNTTKQRVVEHLQNAYSFESGPPWTYMVNGEPCLYVDFYDEFGKEHEPGDWKTIVEQFGEEPELVVVADVSGRHLGDKQVRDFIETLLTAFAGMVQDDYTLHLWSLEEVKNNSLIADHPLF